MSSIQIVTDSTSYISRKYVEENNIEVVPLSINFLGDTCIEGFPGEFESFFTKLKKADDFPKTSQPPIGDFVNVFEKAINEGKEVITIVISSKLSGTYETALAAANIVSPEKITVIDSETSVSNLRVLVELAVKLANSGKPKEEIQSAINDAKKKMGIRLTVGTLEYLKKGGRLSGAQALIGTVLNIKPIIGLIDGKLIPIDKVRGKNKALRSMLKDIPNDVKKISICHILNMDEAKKVKEMLEKEYKGIEISIDELGPVIGSHLGPGALGICYVW